MFEDLLAAFALFCVLEGIMPALAPKRWRVMILKFCMLPTAYVRLFGFCLLIIGAILVSVIAH